MLTGERVGEGGTGGVAVGPGAGVGHQGAAGGGGARPGGARPGGNKSEMYICIYTLPITLEVIVYKANLRPQPTIIYS